MVPMSSTTFRFGKSHRVSLHHEPRSPKEILRHYLRDIVYGANDGVITTFAVVAGATGGALSERSVLVVGMANLFADGLSMGVGNYLAIRSNEGARAAVDLPEEEANPVRHGGMTFLAFVLAGAVPIVPYFVGLGSFQFSGLLTFATLFVVGAMRGLVTVDRWYVAGLEMLALGVLVAGAAFGSGAVAAWLLQ
jgi:vacuolar iron transporter family protein